jgi:hypothetical protein
MIVVAMIWTDMRVFSLSIPSNVKVSHFNRRSIIIGKQLKMSAHR